MPVEERQLLRAMRGIIGGIQIESDAISPAPESLRVTPQDAPGQSLAHSIQLLDSYPIFETRQRRLGGEIETVYWISIQQEFMNGIAGQAGGVVGVRIAAGNREHTLRHQLAQGMIDLARLSRVPQASTQFLQQSIATIRRLQQQSSTIGTALPLITLSHHRLAKNSWEQPTLCCAIVRHEEASECASNIVSSTCF